MQADGWVDEREAGRGPQGKSGQGARVTTDQEFLALFLQWSPKFEIISK